MLKNFLVTAVTVGNTRISVNESCS